ncbi:hypothetical protein L9F63_013111 [Diploptera punctata]|uniref:Uncharacterized protein n=1 Tax=Diploptera punctata TaxID=6984 RepID=A0AAD8AAY4_DIPPU|nr:hypothetical protein L9F63_013111 [Diploptera punctata]
MAFFFSTLRQNYCRQAPLSLQLIKRPICESPKCVSNTYKETVIISKTDPLDAFTSKLVQEKSDKWKYLSTKKIKYPDRRLAYYDECQNSFKSCDIDTVAINELIRKALDSKLYNVILSLLNICKTKKICPSPELLQEVASILSRKGNKAGVKAVQMLCEIHNVNEYIIQAEFKHYKEALGMFEEIYKNYPCLRRKIRNMTKYLVAECVYNKSEASVVLVTNFAKKHALEYRDFYFLTHLWQCLFLSEWFADQKLASELIEEYDELRTTVADRMQFITAIAIRKKCADTIQRLFEVALRYNMKKEYTCILRSFFDHKCSIGDIKSCTEILASALDQNITITTEQHNKFLVLLLSSNNGCSWLSKHKNNEWPHTRVDVPSFQMKF